MRERTGPDGFLSQAQRDLLRTLWIAGARPAQVARLCWREWGYKDERWLYDCLVREAKRLPESERPLISRCGPRQWVGSIPKDEARRMLLAVAPQQAVA